MNYKQDYDICGNDRYREGLKDLYKALCIIASESSTGGMSVSELNNTFGCCSVCNIILGNTPEEIIDKVNRWKAEKDKKDQEFHVGDEVAVDNKLIGIIIDADDDNGTGIIWVAYRITPAARGLDFCWVNRAECKKTGRHFDSIPFDYNPEKGED
ncbi:MAG: hypothetical protein IJ899_03260 [Blautia sp.]|nr:hypothetical protein [Blautia sp.]